MSRVVTVPTPTSRALIHNQDKSCFNTVCVDCLFSRSRCREFAPNRSRDLVDIGHVICVEVDDPTLRTKKKKRSEQHRSQKLKI
jgi:hypothetical protein